MTVRDYILEGLEAELALARELGVRVLDMGGEIVEPPSRSFGAPSPAPRPPQTAAAAPSEAQPQQTAAAAPGKVPGAPVVDAVFLHDAPLSAKAAEIVDKCIAALGWKAQVVTGGDVGLGAPKPGEGGLPHAKVYIAMGLPAVRKFFPGLKGSPGGYAAGRNDVFVAHSPETIVRASADAALLGRLKKEFWSGLKGVKQRHEI